MLVKDATRQGQEPLNAPENVFCLNTSDPDCIDY